VLRLRAKVPLINAKEEALMKLSDAELQAFTPKFKEMLDNGARLDDILVDAFAVGREAGRRVLNMRHYDVQLMGGMVLHNGAIAEMKTGEGKTLVATLPIYLNALEGKGVHLVTVNDYLARRDAEWMGRLYNFLGLSIGVIVNQQPDHEKRASYKADICYGQNNEFGFDYLRDNMKFSALEYAQRPLNFAIVDEVDSILIDEARTPLIISGPAEAASEKYRTLNEAIPQLRRDEHYNVDEKAFSVTLTDEGVELIQKLIGISNLYDPINVQALHILNQLLKAHALYKRDVHYMVSQDGKVLIIDEFTGRVLAGRRWSDGLHQAVEAKENLFIQEESRTMATITFQNLFRIYKKLGGMTGTASTEAQEFHSTYNLDVVEMPPNRPVQRADDEDLVYKTEREKFTALTADILAKHEEGRPVLVGTTSVEKSAAIARILSKKKIPHSVLNAKHHENEAYIVAQAGRSGSITVSTNMAGRGTDILLGGNAEMIARLQFKEANRLPEAEPEAFAALVTQLQADCKADHEKVKGAGGLHIVGTERHESRRIDNQLRGRAGRQGDPGTSRFYLSLEDDLMRIFTGERIKNLMDRMGMPDDEPIEHPWVSKSVENAQHKVEQRNFDIRKNLLEYDDVMNAQRKTVYALRQQLLLGRYEPEQVDELGKPTGERRIVPVNPEIKREVEGLVAQLVGMFGSVPLQVTDDGGRPRAPTREELGKLEGLVDLETLQREVYHLWGVKYDIPRKSRPALETYDELVELVSLGLTEQRERFLDLIDRVLSAMVEESCPANKPPEDWDWGEIHQGFREHFKKPLDKQVEELGELDDLARAVFEQGLAAYVDREKRYGVANMMRFFRHFFLQEIDKEWVDHLTNMEHLRDGIGLRGYGQRDPKNEYKKEGYDLFLNMMANVSSSVLTKLMEFKPDGSRAIETLEAEAEERHQAELEAAIARHPGDEEVAPAAPSLEQARGQAAERPAARAAPKIGRNDPCPCGSGKKFKQCHGSVLEDEQATA
ncbi:MAG TPA: preprotein translocase subunit SecA, partial [Polyangiaceae bacterium]|nr:preprotein translocase subunit SecA [Polyangiaceae bacterium]